MASGIEAVRNIARYQVGPNAQEAFPGISYSLMVDGAGTIYQCWDLAVRCWHNGAVVNGIARNASHIGICFIGDDEPTEGQLAGLLGAVAWTEGQLRRRLDIEGHQDHYATSCPGPLWPWWRHLVDS